MKQRIHAFSTFCLHFFTYVLHVREALFGLVALVCLGALGFSSLEGRTLSESIYFAFITALSIGYGDIAPKTPGGRILSISIGLVGMVFIGLSVAVATKALGDTVKQFHEENTDT
ncbi:potassium channel family protein [Thalassoglobus sp. JC818]|uniref:potassium channel family protein n=1 Tax=Thalassoglobus sp. JC818 TaxID=3232136 RepID=UPI00345B3FE7